MSTTLSLKKKDPAEKIAQSLQLGFRFVDRKGRYILQKQVVVYGERLGSEMGCTVVQTVIIDSTWIDVPLCPEMYGK